MTDLEEIEAELNLVLTEIRSAQAYVRSRARREGLDVMAMQYPDGTYVMHGLSITKAQALSALAPIVQQREARENLDETMAKAKASFLDAVKDFRPTPTRHYCAFVDCHEEITLTQDPGTVWRHVDSAYEHVVGHKARP